MKTKEQNERDPIEPTELETAAEELDEDVLETIVAGAVNPLFNPN